jgi:hypothetical protein
MPKVSVSFRVSQAERKLLRQTVEFFQLAGIKSPSYDVSAFVRDCLREAILALPFRYPKHWRAFYDQRLETPLVHQTGACCQLGRLLKCSTCVKEVLK